MARMTVDELARRARLLRAARVRQIDAAFACSPAIVTEDGSGRRELVIMSPDPSEPGLLRVTYLAVDGPRGHFASAHRPALVEHVADGYPVHARPASEDEVIAWTSTAEFVAGAERVAEVQRANAGRLDRA